MRLRPLFLLTVGLIASTTSLVNAMDQDSDETTCGVVEEAARANQLPVETFTRLIWFESRFDVSAVSRVGAQGIAQFMPATSGERGLSNPFDVGQAIPQSASYLAHLNQQFRNFGLAIAAYNAGPSRIARWLDNSAALPRETSLFVLAVTGRSAEDWAAFGPSNALSPFYPGSRSCVQSRAALKTIRYTDFDQDRGRLMPELKQSGHLLPAVAQSGRLLPEIAQSGRLIRQMAQGGREQP
jgi:hypothetical protein